jgi:CheY-like chemotaxis protein
MQQVLMNLCMNAAHAMEAQGGVLKINLSKVTVNKADGGRDSEVAAGNYGALTVSDTGHGMGPWVQARIFDPYFTTKEPGKGTGLGLSVVHGIVRSHGGAIQVFSEVGKGTTFKVFLPQAKGVEVARPKTARGLPRGTEKILLVDDEAGLAELGKRMLGLQGYQVEARTSPVAALEVFRANPEKFDAVITDMTMPQLTGLSLAREILAIRPEIPIILCTGFSDQANEEKARSAGIRAFLFKPLIMQDLATAVREVLDGPTDGKPPEQQPL